MHNIAVAVYAGRFALTQQCVGFPSLVTRRLNRARIMAAPASDAVLGMHFSVNFLRELEPTRLPELGIAEIVCGFRECVAHA